MEATGNVHILRHTFCSHLAMRGAAPKAIQNLAGHQHLSTTMRYMHLSPSERERSAYSTGGELTAQWRHMTEPRAHLLRITWHSGGADENRTRTEKGHEVPEFQPDRALDKAVESPGSRPVETSRQRVETPPGALNESELEGAIARLTRRLLTAPDDEIGELVTERKAMRAELGELRRAALPDNVTRIR